MRAAVPARSHGVLWVALVVIVCAGAALAWYYLAGPGARRATPSAAASAAEPTRSPPAAPAPTAPPPAAEPQPATAPAETATPSPSPSSDAPSTGSAAPAPTGEATGAAQPSPAAQPTEAAAATPARSEDADFRRLLASADRKYQQGRFEDAISDYRRAAALRPGAQVQVGLARALYDARRNGDALRALELALEQDQTYAPAWLLLGELHQADHRVPEARSAYERFLALNPRGDQARAVREILAKQLK
jgi:hypothetical protein